MKRNWKSGFLWIFIAVMSIAGTAAFFSDFDSKENWIGIGQNESQITEVFPEPAPIIPDGENDYVKRVSVMNNSSVPCFIRVLVVYSDSGIGDAVQLQELNTTDWVYLPEDQNEKLGGYYYYKHIVQSGDITEPLFKGVKISADADLSYPLDSFEVIIYEESVNQDGYNHYMDAWDSFIRE